MKQVIWNFYYQKGKKKHLTSTITFFLISCFDNNQNIKKERKNI